jgi:hypothetical protein
LFILLGITAIISGTLYYVTKHHSDIPLWIAGASLAGLGGMYFRAAKKIKSFIMDTNTTSQLECNARLAELGWIDSKMGTICFVAGAIIFCAYSKCPPVGFDLDYAFFFAGKALMFGGIISFLSGQITSTCKKTTRVNQ